MVAIKDALGVASWRALFGIAAVLTAGGVVAAGLGVYEAGFVALILPLALIAFNDSSQACVLIALASPVVALGAVDLGFHLLPVYPLIAAGFLGAIWRREWRGRHRTTADELLIGFVVLASAITVCNIGVIPGSTVLDAVGANGPRIRPFAQLLALLAMACLYLLFRAGIRARAEFDSVVRALLVAAAFVGAYMVYQVVGRRLGLPFTFVNQRRAAGTLPTNLAYIRPNSTLPEASALAQFAIVPLFLGVGWAASGGPLARWLPPQAPLLIGLAGATAVIATLSKIGLVATALWLPLLVMRTVRRRRRSWVFVVAVLAALLAAVGGVMAARAASQSITGGALVTNERYVRTGYWIAAARMLGDHPLGVGVGNFPFYYPQYAPLSLRYEYLSELADAHNLFLETAAETGLIGGALFLGFIVILVGQGLRSAGRALDDGLPTTGTALAFALAAGATMHLTYSYVYYPFEWVVAGLVGTLPSLEFVARGRIGARPSLDW